MHEVEARSNTSPPGRPKVKLVCQMGSYWFSFEQYVNYLILFCRPITLSNKTKKSMICLSQIQQTKNAFKGGVCLLKTIKSNFRGNGLLSTITTVYQNYFCPNRCRSHSVSPEIQRQTFLSGNSWNTSSSHHSRSGRNDVGETRYGRNSLCSPNAKLGTCDKQSDNLLV